jgi:Ca2+-binding EF-hand superfamily protein
LKSEISAADKWIMKPYFDLMDTNQDGKISEREFQQYTNYDEEAIHRLFQEADLNNDGFIDLNEFIAIIKKYSGKSKEWDILYNQLIAQYNS